MIALELLLNQRCISFLAQFGKVLYGAFIYSYSTALRIPFGCPIYHSGIFLTGDELRRWTKGYKIKQPNMDCQPTEITALTRHRAVFSWAEEGGIPTSGA